MLYVTVIGLLLLIWSGPYFYKQYQIARIKRSIFSNTLFESIFRFEQCIPNKLIFSPGDRDSFFKSVVFYFEKVEDAIRRPELFSQIDTWAISECTYVLEFIKKGTRHSHVATLAQERITKGRHAIKDKDKELVDFENLKLVKVLLEPKILDVVITISIRVENRLCDLFDSLYYIALQARDAETAIEIYTAKLYCFYIALDIWTPEEYDYALHDEDVDAEIFMHTGVQLGVDELNQKVQEIIYREGYKKYIY